MTELHPSQAASRPQAGQLCLLDVRTPAECALAAVDGALCIPLDRLPERKDQLPTDRPIAVLCHHGIRSAQAGLWLERSGFAPIFNVAGGIDRWAIEVDSAIPRY